VTLALSASNLNPVIDATSTITATVTQNGSPVPNGTAVEFVTSAGTFIDVTPAVTSLIRTTTNGIATVNLTSPNAVVAHVTATVNNVTRSIDITFKTVPPCIPPDPRCPPGTQPEITSVSPTTGKPQGGDIIHITGKNFFAPVRVLFDVGTGTPIQGFVTNISDTALDVITPAVNLGAGQQLVADIIIVTQVGSSTEGRVVGNDVFTFRNVSLTPIIHSLSPTSGPINGGTRVTIFGEGFQAPVQVFFGSAEAQVISTDFSQILVVAPDGRSTSGNGSTTTLGPVPVRVVNINSNTRGDSPEPFRYVSKLTITGINPLVGPATGGTDLRIDGIGFDSPIDVTVAGVRAQTLSVTGTRVVARLGPLASPCATGGGPVVVTNIENGDSDIYGPDPTEQNFIYQAVAPRILDVQGIPAGGIVAGSTLTAIVRNPGVGPLGTAQISFLIGDRPVVTSPNQISNGAGDQSFTLTLPTNLDFPSVACTVAGEPGVQLGATVLAITFRNLTTSCTDSIPGAVRVIPDPVANPCVVPPPPDVEQVVPIGSACANAGVVTAAGTATGTATITFRNAGGRTLLITPNPPFTGGVPPGAESDFSIPPDTLQLTAGQQGSFSVTFNPSATGSRQATINFTTNDPDASEQSINVCVQGTGN